MASKILRSLGVQDKFNINDYKRFASFPKNMTTNFGYRGDTRLPETIKPKGFFPQAGRASVSSDGKNAGASTAMVCGTLSPSVAATYYSLRKYFNAKNPECKAENFTGNGYVYAFFIPTGRGILNYELANMFNRTVEGNERSKNSGSLEISTLCVPWSNVIGWRKLPKQDECKTAAGAEGGLIAWADGYTQNGDYTGHMNFNNDEERVRFQIFQTSADLFVFNSKML